MTQSHSVSISFTKQSHYMSICILTLEHIVVIAIQRKSHCWSIRILIQSIMS